MNPLYVPKFKSLWAVATDASPTIPRRMVSLKHRMPYGWDDEVGFADPPTEQRQKQ